MPEASQVRLTPVGKALERWYFQRIEVRSLAAAWDELSSELSPAHPDGVSLALCLIAASSRAGLWKESQLCRGWLLRSFINVYGPEAHEVRQSRRLLARPEPASQSTNGLWSLEGLPGVGKTAFLLDLCSTMLVAPEPLHSVGDADHSEADLPEKIVHAERLRRGFRHGVMESSVLRQLGYGLAAGRVWGDWTIYERSASEARRLGVSGNLTLPGTVLLVTLPEAERRARLASRRSHKGIPACGPEWNDDAFRQHWESGLLLLAARLGIEVQRVSAYERNLVCSFSTPNPPTPPHRLAQLPAGSAL